jgi:hypothetical protein
MTTTEILAWVFILGVVTVILAYAVVRAASFAHFRTKLEYLRSVLKELRGGK